MGVKLAAASGGSIELVPTNTASNFTVTVPAVTGTMLTTATAGTVLQVVSAATTTNTSTTSSSFVAVTNLTASITPSSATSKIFIQVNTNIYGASLSSQAVVTIYKNGVDLTAGSGFASVYSGNSDIIQQAPMLYLDSPATTSSTTYAVYFKRTQGTLSIQTGFAGTTNTITLMEIAA
jgi:hypothetical protein